MQREGRQTVFLCRVSCLEIHKEVLTDLLSPERTRLQLREDFKQGVYVDSLSEETVASGEPPPCTGVTHTYADEPWAMGAHAWYVTHGCPLT